MILYCATNIIFCWIIITCSVISMLSFSLQLMEQQQISRSWEQCQCDRWGERGSKNYLPQKTTSFLLHRMTTWTALSPILSIKPVSSRAPGRSRLFPRTCDQVVVVIVIVIVIVHMLHHCLLWSRSAPTKKDKVTRIGIPASCGRSRRLCSSLRLA